MQKELTSNEKSLLEISSKELCEMLTERTDLIHVKQCAYAHYSKETDEEFQVQITVTRSKSDFLEAFTTEEMRNHNR